MNNIVEKVENTESDLRAQTTRYKWVITINSK